jgi:hypothetical protein
MFSVMERAYYKKIENMLLECLVYASRHPNPYTARTAKELCAFMHDGCPETEYKPNIELIEKCLRRLKDERLVYCYRQKTVSKDLAWMISPRVSACDCVERLATLDCIRGDFEIACDLLAELLIYHNKHMQSKNWVEGHLKTILPAIKRYFTQEEWEDLMGKGKNRTEYLEEIEEQLANRGLIRGINK